MNRSALAARAAASTCCAGGAGRAVGDVGVHRVVEQHRVLAHHAHQRPQRAAGEPGERHAVHQDPPAGRVVEPRQQVGQRGLPRPGRARPAPRPCPWAARTRRRSAPGRPRRSGRSTRSKTTSRSNRASPSPGRSTSVLGSSRISNTRSALASVTAMTAGIRAMVLSGEVSLSAAIRKTMIASGASGAPSPMSAGPGAGPDDQDHQEAGEDLGQRAGERARSAGSGSPASGSASAWAREARRSRAPPRRRRGSAGRRRSAR